MDSEVLGRNSDRSAGEVFGEGSQTPCLRLLQQRARDQIVQGVACLDAFEAADQRRAKGVKVAYRVQRLVAHEFVMSTQTLWIEQALAIERDNLPALPDEPE